MLRKIAVIVLSSLPFAIWWAPLATAAEKDREALENRLKKEFLNAPVVMIQEGLYTGEYSEEKRLFGFDPVYRWSMTYWRVSAERAEKDKQAWQKCCTSLGDGRTFQTTNGAYRAAPIAPGERLKVIYIKVLDEIVNIIIQADQSLHGGAAATSNAGQAIGGGSNITYKNQWGFGYNFIIDSAVLNAGNYEAVVSEIRNVLLPAEEAKQKNKIESTGTARPAPGGTTKKFEIKIGMTREDVIEGLGAPNQSIVAGAKELLKFSEISVVIENGKVVDVKF